ncbi:hypothetical protein Sjap_017451 [Stephania japonica]|uniref:Alcohol dehydrogenase n=1 Tax=Stephania japonica TaxID=461633 RepID=A0AAP0NM04_9MAGN
MENAGKPIRCRAAVCRKAGEALRIEEVVVAPPEPREVRIKIICSSLCRTDVTRWRISDQSSIFPRIFGHEAVGVVESLGENVNEVKEGDTVIPTFISDCRECEDCLSEKSNHCSKFPHKVSPWMPRYETSRFTDSKGEPVYHFVNVSSFSEYTVVDVAHITKIDPLVPPNKACLLSCGISTGFGAAWKTAKVEKGSTVAIFGLGKKFGVTDFINPKDCENGKPVREVIKEMTNGGADYCFECVGSASVVCEAYASCRKAWGKVIVLGVDLKSNVSISALEFLRSGKTLTSSIFGSLKAKTDIPILLQWYMNKELNLDDYVTHEVGFEDINKAFDLLRDAAVCRKAGEALRIEEVVVAPPEPGEVRIKIICAALCHTDFKRWQLNDQFAVFPRIFGHEGVGVVESVGKNVTEVKEGDTVIPSFSSNCKECEDCLSEKNNFCSQTPFWNSPWMPRYQTSRFTDVKGEPLYHFMSVSSFSEYTVVDVHHVTKIDSTIPSDKACLLGCGISTGFGAAWKTAKVEKGSSVAIFGIGTVGLSVAQGAKFCGATKIIGVDVNPAKFEIGKKFGVTDFINSNDCDNDKHVSEIIKEMTNGGADFCFECVGLASVVRQAFDSCRKGWGKLIFIGIDPKCQESIGTAEILLSGKTLMGTIFGGLKAKTDIPILLQHYLNKELNLDDFVSHKVGFEDINKAFDLLVEGKGLRCVIWMDQEN